MQTKPPISAWRTDLDQSLWTVHGGNLAGVQALFPEAPHPWIDLSTGINAISYPIGSLSEEIWARLPDADALADLESTAGRAYGVASPLQTVAAPGSQCLIQILPHLLPSRQVAILGFGYQEHAIAWARAGAELRVVGTVHELCEPDVGVAVVINPNNPDGRLVDPPILLQMAADLTRHDGLLIVDEAFMDVVRPTASLVPLLPKEGVIVLRSFGKTYGLAGIRLGFAITGPYLARKLRAALGPWAVSGPAIAVGKTALADRRWLEETVARLTKDVKRLDRLLISRGFTIIGGPPLFRLAGSREAASWFIRLARQGILVRAFQDRAEWLRFGIPGGEPAWERLEKALQL